MANLENSWAEYTLAVKSFNTKLRKRLKKELEDEIAEWKKRPWYLRLLARDMVWIEMSYAIQEYHGCKEPSVEDCLTWLSNNKRFV